ncbi:unnamed protein product [Pedinophyceae sp. YPF-701]|nr:unnamed protein product [Pedinophyceae sp. YPF-701]
MASNPATAPPSAREGAHLEEEEVLGFSLWVAELEVLTGGGKRDGQTDQIALLDLLSKMLLSLRRASPAEVKAHQAPALARLAAIASRGPSPPIRRLVAGVYSAIFRVGDVAKLHAVVGDALDDLAPKRLRGLSPARAAMAFELLARMVRDHGHAVTGSLTEAATLCAKAAQACQDDSAREGALRCLSAVMLALAPLPDSTYQGVPGTALRAAERAWTASRSDGTSLAALAVIVATSRVAGEALWQPLGTFRGAWIDEVHRILVAGACGASLTNATQQALRPAGPLQRTGPQVAGAGSLWAAVATAWTSHLRTLRSWCSANDGLLVAAVTGLLEAVDAAVEPPSSRRAGAAAVEVPGAQAAAALAVHGALLPALSQPGRHAFIAELCRFLEAPAEGDTRPVNGAAAAMQCLRMALELLGEIGVEERQAVTRALRPWLSCGVPAVQGQAALVVQTLLVCESSHALQLVSEALQDVQAAASELIAKSVSGQRRAGGGLFRPRSAQLLAEEQHAAAGQLLGRALATASMLCSARQLPLGAPADLPTRAYSIARTLVGQGVPAQGSQADIVSQAVSLARGAGYHLIAGAAALAPPVELSQEGGVDVWEIAFGGSSVPTIKDLLVRGRSADLTLVAELEWRSAAMDALASWLVASKERDAAERSRAFGVLQKHLLPLVKFAGSTQLLWDILTGGPRPKLREATLLFLVRAVSCLEALTPGEMRSLGLKPLLAVCLPAVQVVPAAAQGSAPLQVCPSALLAALARADDILSPAVPAMLWEEATLEAADNLSGPCDVPRPWQPRIGALGAARTTLPHQLARAQCALLARALLAAPESAATQVLDVLVANARAAHDARVPPWRHAGLMRTTAYASLALVRGVAGARGQAPGRVTRVDFAAKVIELARNLRASCPHDTAVLRATAEIVALAAKLLEPQQAAGLVQSTLQDIQAAVDSLARPGPGIGVTVASLRISWTALCLGMTSRALGLAIQGDVRQITKTLVAALCNPRLPRGAQCRVWLGHALTLLCEGLGPRLLPDVASVLHAAHFAAMAEGQDAPGLHVAVCRLVNALIGAVGPELTPGSARYAQLRALLREPGVSAESGGDDPGASAQLAARSTTIIDPFSGCVTALDGGLEPLHNLLSRERVLCLQQFVLYAPQLINLPAMLPPLCVAVRYTQPPVQRAAAATVRHLVECDPRGAVDLHVEHLLLRALGAGIDAVAAESLRAALRTLLAHGARDCFDRWVAICKEVILEAAPGAETQGRGGDGGAPQAEDGGGGEDDSGSEGDEGEARAVEAEERQAGRGGAEGGPQGGAVEIGAYLLDSRVLAAECLITALEGGLVGVGDAQPAAVPPTQPASRTEDAGDGGGWAAFGGGGDGAGAGADDGWNAFADTGARTNAQEQTNGSPPAALAQLGPLVQLGYALVAGELETLRQYGARLLLAAVRAFRAVEDPALPGVLALEQHVAVLVSATRSGLSRIAQGPVAGLCASLAVAILESGVCCGDDETAERLLAALCAPLSAWEESTRLDHCNSWVASHVRLALLSAHAAVRRLQHTPVACLGVPPLASKDGCAVSDSIVDAIQGPHVPELARLWAGASRDALVCLHQLGAGRAGRERLAGYRPQVLPLAPTVWTPALRRFFESALTDVLPAALCEGEDGDGDALLSLTFVALSARVLEAGEERPGRERASASEAAGVDGLSPHLRPYGWMERHMANAAVDLSPGTPVGVPLIVGVLGGLAQCDMQSGAASVRLAVELVSRVGGLAPGATLRCESRETEAASLALAGLLRLIPASFWAADDDTEAAQAVAAIGAAAASACQAASGNAPLAAAALGHAAGAAGMSRPWAVEGLSSCVDRLSEGDESFVAVLMAVARGLVQHAASAPAARLGMGDLEALSGVLRDVLELSTRAESGRLMQALFDSCALVLGSLPQLTMAMAPGVEEIRSAVSAVLTGLGDALGGAPEHVCVSFLEHVGRSTEQTRDVAQSPDSIDSVVRSAWRGLCRASGGHMEDTLVREAVDVGHLPRGYLLASVALLPSVVAVIDGYKGPSGHVVSCAALDAATATLKGMSTASDMAQPLAAVLEPVLVAVAREADRTSANQGGLAKKVVGAATALASASPAAFKSAVNLMPEDSKEKLQAILRSGVSGATRGGGAGLAAPPKIQLAAFSKLKGK